MSKEHVIPELANGADVLLEALEELRSAELTESGRKLLAAQAIRGARRALKAAVLLAAE